MANLINTLKQKLTLLRENQQPLRANCLLTRWPIVIECEPQTQKNFWSLENRAFRMLQRHGYEVQLKLTTAAQPLLENMHYLKIIESEDSHLDKILDRAIALAEQDYINTLNKI